MFEAYSIGVTLKVHNLISPQLAILSAEMKEVERFATLLHASMKKLGAVGMGALNTSLGVTNRAFERATVSAGALQARIVSMHSAASLPLPAMLAPPRTAYAPGGGGRAPAGGGGHGTGGFHGANLHANSGGLGVSGIGIGLGGAGMVAAGGVMGLMALKGPVAHALDWERDMAHLRQMGLNKAQTDEAESYVRTTKILGSTMSERMKIFADAQGSFRESGMDGSHALAAARDMMPALTKYQVASELLGGPNAGAVKGAMLSLNKTMEMMGAIGNTKRAEEISTAAFKAVQSSGKMVSERDLKQFIAMGGSAVSGLSDKTIFAILEPLMGEMGGSSLGTAMLTGFNRTHGIMSAPPKLMVREMLRLGVWDKSKLEFNSAGGIKQMHGMPMDKNLAHLQETDDLGFVKAMMEVYQSHGVLTSAEKDVENQIIFGRTDGKVMSRKMAQFATMEASGLAFDRALGPGEVIDKEKDGPLMTMKKLTASMSDLSLVIGQTAIKLAPVVDGISSVFTWLGKYPMLLKVLTVGFIALAAAMAIGGTIALLRIGFAGLGSVLGTAGLLGVLGKAGIAGVAAFAVIEVGRLALALMDLFNIKTRDGVKLNPDAASRLNDPANKAQLEAMNSDFRGANQLPPGGMTATGKYGFDYMKSPAGSQSTLHTSVVMLDKRVLGTALTEFQAKEFRRPTSNARSPDGIMNLQGNY